MTKGRNVPPRPEPRPKDVQPEETRPTAAAGLAVLGFRERAREVLSDADYALFDTTPRGTVPRGVPFHCYMDGRRLLPKVAPDPPNDMWSRTVLLSRNSCNDRVGLRHCIGVGDVATGGH